MNSSMNKKIPESLKQYLKDRPFHIDEIGQSGSTVIVFDDMVLKIEKQCEEADNERRMMQWLSGRLPIPTVIGAETVDGMNYLLMSKMQGQMSCEEAYMNHPDELVTALAEGLKLLWAVDISECPYQSNLDNKLRLAACNVEHGLVDVDNVEPETFGEHGFKSPAHLLEWLIGHKPHEELVLSHGDFCLPNVFLKDGKISGFIDLGRCGAADRWQDIALCYRSLSHNFRGDYGGKVYNGDADLLFEKLGIEPDSEKLRYYILLDELF